MTMFRSRSPVKSVMLSMFAVALATCTLLGSSQQANAGPLSAANIKVYDDGVLLTAGVDYTAVGSGSAGNWLLTVTSVVGKEVNFSYSSVFGSSNQPGNLIDGATIGTNNTNVKQLTSGTHTFKVVFSDNGFSIPSGAGGILTSSGGITYISGTTKADFGTLQSAVDPGNALFAKTITHDPQTSTSNGTPNNTDQFNPDPGMVFIPGVLSTYSLTSETIITLNNQNAKVTLQSSTTVTTPEPATFTLLGVGLVGMAGYGWRKRRQQLTQTVA